MKKFLNKFLTFALIISYNIFAFAQPVDPEIPGGVGGSGTGSPSSPIDMYVIVLAAVAVIFAFYFAKKYTKQFSK